MPLVDGLLVRLQAGTRVDTWRLPDGEVVAGFAIWSTGPTIMTRDDTGAFRTITLPTRSSP